MLYLYRSHQGGFHVAMRDEFQEETNSMVKADILTKLDDIVHKLRKAKYMACFDALKGFFHVPLDDNSKLLTAMLTPIGVFIYNVLTMGLTYANDL